MTNSQNHATTVINKLAQLIAAEPQAAAMPCWVMVREAYLNEQQQPAVRVVYYPLTGNISRTSNGNVILEVSKDNKREQIEQLTQPQIQNMQVQGMLPQVP